MQLHSRIYHINPFVTGNAMGWRFRPAENNTVHASIEEAFLQNFLSILKRNIQVEHEDVYNLLYKYPVSKGLIMKTWWAYAIIYGSAAGQLKLECGVYLAIRHLCSYVSTASIIDYYNYFIE